MKRSGHWLRFHTSVEAILTVNPGLDSNQYVVGKTINIPDESKQYEKRALHCISKAAVELKSAMRLLWEQHVSWTRMTIISIVFQLKDVDFVVARLIRNATDMGNSLKPFYNEDIANK